MLQMRKRKEHLSTSDGGAPGIERAVLIDFGGCGCVCVHECVCYLTLVGGCAGDAVCVCVCACISVCVD